MSLEKITSKILDDARGEAEAIVSDAKLRAGGILKSAEDEAKDLEKSYNKKGLEEKNKLIIRRKSVAENDARKMTLSSKQELIKACFQKAGEKVASMDHDDYINFMVGKMLESGLKHGQIVLNQKDRDSVGNDLIVALNDAIDGGTFNLADETRNIMGGFMVKQGDIYMNATIESLVDEAKNEIMADVVSKLFASDN